MTMEEQEGVILDDLLWVFMGYEGQYIRFVESYNPAEEKDRLAGPSFRILSGLDPSLRDLTTSMLQMATHYSALEAFVEVQSREEFGAINHALSATIRKLLKDYLILMAQLETQLLNNTTLTLHVLHLHTLPTGQSLLQLYSLAQELLKRNSLLEQDLDESVDDFDVDNILEQLREGGDLVPGGMSSKRICKGGNVLGLLTNRLASLSGDPAARNLLQTLLREASRPYMTMLNEWLHHGGIKDPHAEFLVKEQKGIKRERLEEDYTDEYWEKRYTIRDNDVPPQLESVRDKVLLAGKYLNVVRECGGVDISKEVKDVPKTFDDPRFLDNVNGAYAYANASLLNLLLTKNSLTTRFRSLKHYFFLDRSDFFSYFLELSASELRKPAKNVNVPKLQSLLDLVLRQPGSIAAQDPFKEDVKIQMNEVGLTKWLMRVVSVSGFDQDNPDAAIEKYQTPAPEAPKDDEKDIVGFDALELDYSVPFPLSLVISRKTVLRYQLLFRYLLSLRHLETLLVSCWQDHSKIASWTHKSSNPKIELWKRRAFTLRARMLVFVQQLLYFCTAEVIEPNWQNLMARVDTDGKSTNGKQVVNRTVDELMQDHVDFLDTCLKECMLTQGKLLKVRAPRNRSTS
jgi:gamma-tubulin complex component 2